jgi:hypothetical protein
MFFLTALRDGIAIFNIFERIKSHNYEKNINNQFPIGFDVFFCSKNLQKEF